MTLPLPLEATTPALMPVEEIPAMRVVMPSKAMVGGDR